MSESEVSGKVIKKNMLWNVAGSTGFIAAQWLMTILIVHLADYTEAGYLSLGLSLTNVFTNIAYFCIRNFQVSDAKPKYSSDTYVTHRFITVLLALFIYIVFVLMNGYSVYVTAFLIFFMGYRLCEPIVDVFHGIDQKAWRLDIAGKSFLLRGMLTLLCFVVVEKLTGNLVITAAVMFLAVTAIWFFYDFPKAYKLESFQLSFEKAPLASLTRECFPLFLYAICLNATVPITRYYLEKIEGSELLGFYSSVAIPASVIQLFSSYVFTTFIKLFTDYLEQNEKKKFLSLLGKLMAVISGILVLALLGSWLLGEWALVLVFTEKIRAYAYLLVPTVFCCGIIAFIWFYGSLLTILRDRGGLLTGAIAGMLTSLITSVPFIRLWGVNGVNVTLLLSSVVTLVIFGARLFHYMKNWKI